MTRSRAIDEFESIFERASIPVFDIPDLELERVCAIIRNDELDESILKMAGYLKDRKGFEVTIAVPDAVDEERAKTIAVDAGFGIPFRYESPAELAGDLKKSDIQLVLLPSGQNTEAQTIDLLVEEVHVPVLIIDEPIIEPEKVFSKVLHSVTGNIENVNHLAYSFDLTERKGELVLIHTINEDEIEDVRRVLNSSSKTDSRGREELMRGIGKDAEKYLKAMVASNKRHDFDISYRLMVGEPLVQVKNQVEQEKFTLLVVGTHHAGKSHVNAAEYQLMHQVKHIPVLAL